MAFTQIYINLPVADLEASKAFYQALGGTVNPQFSDETSAQIVLSETIAVQLMTHEQFSGFTKREIASGPIEAINALAAESKEDVDRLVEAAVGAGGSEPRPAQDMGWLYSRAVDDLDGHCWELMAYDPSAMPAGPE